jgi:Fibronectin type III domain
MKYFLMFFGFVFFIFLALLFPLRTNALTGPEDPFSFSAVSGAQPGTVTITWYDDQTAKQYNLLYGTDPNHYNFGAVNLPDAPNTSNSFTINYLTPGVTYYFTLIGMNGTSPIYSGPVAATATAQSEGMQQITSHLPEYGFTAQTGAASGTVQLSWTDNGSAQKYDIVYGSTPGTYLYGVENIPFNPNIANAFTVGALTPGVRYYFELVAEKNGSIVLWSTPVSAIAK